MNNTQNSSEYPHQLLSLVSSQAALFHNWLILRLASTHDIPLITSEEFEAIKKTLLQHFSYNKEYQQRIAFISQRRPRSSAFLSEPPTE